MPIGATIGAVGALGSAGISAYASGRAADKQSQLGYSALDQQNALFNKALGLNQPFIDAGTSASKTLLSLLTPGPNQTDILSQLPGFQFAQDWGQKAVKNLGSTLGFGGNTLKAGADYATGAAQQGFGTLAGLLQNLTATGAGSAASAFGNATATGANMGTTLTGIGNAQAAGTLGTANALAGGLTGGANSITNAMLFSRLLNNGGAGGGIYSNPNALATLNKMPTDI